MAILLANNLLKRDVFSGTSWSLRAGVCCVFIMLLWIMVSLVSIASAHNVVSGVYADGMLIEGEIGFSNGDMAKAGSPVKVLNADGDLIAELVLEDGGMFSYEAKTVAKHVFKADLSAGHIAEMIIEADELTAGDSTAVSRPSLKDPTPNNTQSNSATLSSEITADQLQTIVRSAVAQQIRPLQKELKAYKEKVMLRDIAGGLGFIFGLFGVAAWMASRRKDKLKEGEE